MPSLPFPHTQIYMYCVWHGWIIQLFLFLAILKLSLNYLHTRYSTPPSVTLPFVLMIIHRRPGNGTVLLSSVFLALFPCSPTEKRGRGAWERGQCIPAVSILEFLLFCSGLAEQFGFQAQQRSLQVKSMGVILLS